jgi:hypothetical protein
LDHIVLVDEGYKRDNHVNEGDLIVEVKEDIDVPLDVLDNAQ